MSLRQRVKNIQFLRELAMRIRLLGNNYIPTIGGGNTIKRKGISIHSKIKIRGKNNVVVFKYGSVLLNIRIEINGNNNYILISEASYLDGTSIIIEDNNCKLSIGKHTFIGASHLAVTEKNRCLSIGDDCMISSNVQIRTGDSHAIYNELGERINGAVDVVIGNMVWLGEGSKVLKGVTLSDNTIVSTGAIVTKSFGSNVLLGGIPAKVIKDNVHWTHER